MEKCCVHTMIQLVEPPSAAAATSNLGEEDERQYKDEDLPRAAAERNICHPSTVCCVKRSPALLNPTHSVHVSVLPFNRQLTRSSSVPMLVHFQFYHVAFLFVSNIFIYKTPCFLIKHECSVSAQFLSQHQPHEVVFKNTNWFPVWLSLCTMFLHPVWGYCCFLCKAVSFTGICPS
ncbi:hypothetical protein ILYODFUR_029725 [Ilyodon furcidens]|uniref:Uncharacterized protein n=1 Tax=Ilyodon furcidens TaxID=33524 RepID=A0ABV0V778_9TELE